MAAPYFTPLPQSVGIEITSRCNLACRHCFNRSGEGRVEELSLAALVDLFDQCRAMGLTSVRISGGEPTLHRDFPAVVAAATERGARGDAQYQRVLPARDPRPDLSPADRILPGQPGRPGDRQRPHSRPGDLCAGNRDCALAAEHRPRRDPGRPPQPGQPGGCRRVDRTGRRPGCRHQVRPGAAHRPRG